MQQAGQRLASPGTASSGAGSVNRHAPTAIKPRHGPAIYLRCPLNGQGMVPMIHEIPSRTLGFVINDVARLMRKRFEQRARAASLGLTRAQAAVLANLARQEGINQVSLAQILELEPITLARLLDRLQAARLIERRPDPKDRRAHLLYLTDAAFPLLDRIFALAAVVREDALAGVAEPQRSLLLDTLIAMKANLTEEAIDAEGAGEPEAAVPDD